MDPIFPVYLETHDRRSGHALGKQFRIGAKVCVDTHIDEARPPTPLAGVDENGFRVAAIVIVEDRDTEGLWRSPVEPQIETRLLVEIDRRARLVLLNLRYEAVEGRKREMAKGGRLFVIERPPSKR